MASVRYILPHFKWFSGHTYADSIGKGWFGWVIEAKYEGQKVMVQTLREEATQIEKAEFLRQLLPMQSVTNGHENIVSLIGVSLDEPPYLAILEFCGNAGDLKTFLINATGYYF